MAKTSDPEKKCENAPPDDGGIRRKKKEAEETADGWSFLLLLLLLNMNMYIHMTKAQTSIPEKKCENVTADDTHGMMVRTCNELDTADGCSILFPEERPPKEEKGLKKTERKASSGGNSSLSPASNNKEPAFTWITKSAAQICSLIEPMNKWKPLLRLFGIFLSGANGKEVPEAVELGEASDDVTTSSIAATWTAPNGIVEYYDVSCPVGDPSPPKVNPSDNLTASCVNLPRPGDSYSLSVTTFSNGQRSETDTITITASPKTNRYKVAFYILLGIVVFILVVIIKTFTCIRAWCENLWDEEESPKDSPGLKEEESQKDSSGWKEEESQKDSSGWKEKSEEVAAPEQNTSKGKDRSLPRSNKKRKRKTCSSKFAVMKHMFKWMLPFLLFGTPVTADNVYLQREDFRKIIIATNETQIATDPNLRRDDYLVYSVFATDGNDDRIGYECTPDFVSKNQSCRIVAGDRSKAECEGLLISMNGSYTYLAVDGSKLTYDRTTFCILERVPLPGSSILYYVEVSKKQEQDIAQQEFPGNITMMTNETINATDPVPTPGSDSTYWKNAFIGVAVVVIFLIIILILTLVYSLCCRNKSMEQVLADDPDQDQNTTTRDDVGISNSHVA